MKKGGNKIVFLLLGVVLLVLLFLFLITALVLIFKPKIPLPFQKSFDNQQFLTQLKEKIIQEDWLNTKDYTALTIKKQEGEFAGSDWINKNNKVELVKGYSLLYNPFGNDYTQTDPAIPDGAKKIKSYLIAQGFKVNQKNTYFETNEESFWSIDKPCPGRVGFEKDDLKCVFSTISGLATSGFTLNCADLSKTSTPVIYQEIYASTNPEDNPLSQQITIDNYLDNFAVGGISSGMGGAAVIWKNENGKWEVIDGTQMAWNCQVLLDNKVPPSLFKNPETECLYYNQTDQTFQNYQKLYQEKFGQ